MVCPLLSADEPDEAGEAGEANMPEGLMEAPAEDRLGEIINE